MRGYSYIQVHRIRHVYRWIATFSVCRYLCMATYVIQQPHLVVTQRERPHCRCAAHPRGSRNLCHARVPQRAIPQAQLGRRRRQELLLLLLLLLPLSVVLGRGRCLHHHIWERGLGPELTEGEVKYPYVVRCRPPRSLGGVMRPPGSSGGVRSTDGSMFLR